MRSATDCSIELNGMNLLLVCFYNPSVCPGKPKDDQLPPDTVLRLFTEVYVLASNYNGILICGDFNLTDADWRDYTANTTETQKLMDWFLENDMQQVVDFPTATSGILDLVFATPSLDLISCSKTSQSLNTLSNHDGVKCKFEIKDFQSNYLSNSQIFVHHSYCRADFEAMNRHILDYLFIGICWSNVDVLLEQWYEWINLIVKEYTPRLTKHRCSLAPWVKPRSSKNIKRPNTARRKQPSNFNKICKLEATCENFLSEDCTDFETKLANNRCTDELFKYFRTFKSTTNPATVHQIGCCFGCNFTMFSFLQALCFHFQGVFCFSTR